MHWISTQIPCSRTECCNDMALMSAMDSKLESETPLPQELEHTDHARMMHPSQVVKTRPHAELGIVSYYDEAHHARDVWVGRREGTLHDIQVHSLILCQRGLRAEAKVYAHLGSPNMVSACM